MMRALARHAMCAMMPTTDELPGLADTDVDAYLAHIAHEADFLFRFGLTLGALVFALTPVLTLGIPLPSFLLARKQLAWHTERIADSDNYLLRQAVFLVRLNAGLCWGADPRVRAHFALPAYPPDPGTFRL